jgi:hypothetical protein
MTAASGGSVIFNCSGTYVTWALYNPKYTLIFDSRDNTVVSPNPSKYSIVGTNLMISGLDPAQDGTTYECRTSGTSLTRVNLVVIDQSSLKANMYSSGTLTVGNVVSFSCSVGYGAPTTDTNAATKSLSSEQDPQLSMTLDGQPLPETVGMYTQPTGGSGYHTKTLTCNYTLRAADGGKSLTCSVTSLSYTQQPDKVMLNLPYAPNRLNYTANGTYRVGDRVTCVANGSPAPTVTWIPITDGLSQQSGGRGGGSAMLTVMESTVNPQIWTCVASNDYGNFSSGQIKIYVDGAETGQAQPKPDNKVGLGVGLGIGLGVPVVIAIIVLVFVLMRRKRTAGGTDVTKTKPPPPSTDTGKPPINEPHRPQRPTSGTRNGPAINPNPNPMYQPPVYPEQVVAGSGLAPPKTTPDRPGYGDLGVGHIHAGGSTPSLNRSYESSHSGGHQGPNTSV